MTTLTLNQFSLTLQGFSVTYTINGRQETRSFCPFATCELFESLGLIEGFDKDRNGEPVILFTDHQSGVCRAGFVFWFRFIEGFKVSQRMAEIIVDRLEMTKEFSRSHAIINRLMKPLQAAA